MKLALCTTTIHIPHALTLMRKCSSEVKFFVAMDTKTPREAYDFVSGLDNAHHYWEGDGDWKCSRAIGPNTLARRNIAFLEALAWGAEMIYSWDTDNLPLCSDHFYQIINAFAPSAGFTGIQLGGAEWFDPGCLLIPPTRHRGIPHVGHVDKHASFITEARVGVAAGLVLGDPDIDATTRMELRPDIGAIHVLGQTGIVVERNSRTVFNSQNTAVIRELIPAYFMMPGVGRHDDLYASLIVQKVARKRDYHVHFGAPLVYQQRHPHNLITDLRAEIDGMENVQKLAEFLDTLQLHAGHDVLEDTCTIYSALQYCDFLPRAAVDAALVWIEDCAEAMK